MRRRQKRTPETGDSQGVRWQPARPRSRRAGVGLADTVGLLFFVGLILSLSAVILHRALLSQGNAMEYLAMTQNLQSAHNRWTADALTSTKCEVGDDLRITCADDRQISYAWESGQLVRSTAERNGPKAPYAVIGQEHWQLPTGCQLIWSIDRSQPVSLVVCSLEVPNQAPVRWVSRAELGVPVVDAVGPSAASQP